jgi:hypothetical protein
MRAEPWPRRKLLEAARELLAVAAKADVPPPATEPGLDDDREGFAVGFLVEPPERSVSGAQRQERLARRQQPGLDGRVTSPTFVPPARWATIPKRICSKCRPQPNPMGCRMVNDW